MATTLARLCIAIIERINIEPRPDATVTMDFTPTRCERIPGNIRPTALAPFMMTSCSGELWSVGKKKHDDVQR
jgi:hypothetical protein